MPLNILVFLLKTDLTMSSKLKNRLLYWILAAIPLALIVLAGKINGSYWFVAFLGFYVFIYRPALDTQRLLSLRVIEEKDAWKFFIPLAVDRTRYFKPLWLG